MTEQTPSEHSRPEYIDTPMRQTHRDQMSARVLDVAILIATPFLIYALMTLLLVLMLITNKYVDLDWFDTLTRDLGDTWWGISGAINKVIPEWFVLDI